MVSEKEVDKLLNEVEAEFITCWDILSGIKENRLTSEDLFNFQPILATVLFKLDSKYRKIRKEEKNLISRKNHIALKWFKDRLKRLNHYKTSIENGIKLGKVLGDSFAWIFYNRDHQYLNKHYKHQLIMHTPPGIGGLGELEFIKNVKVTEKHFVLYHGITTFLRVGDVSLISLKDLRVSAIGELKTKKVSENEISVFIVIVSSEEGDFSKNVVSKISKSSEISEFETTPEIKQKLLKQLTEMDSVFEKKEYMFNETHQIPGYHVDELNTLVSTLKNEKFAYQKVGDGLLLIGFENNQKTLASRLKGPGKNFNKIYDDFEQYALDICDLDSVRSENNENCAIIGFLDPTFIENSTPLFWWPIDLEFIRKLIFAELIVTSVYNPYHLIKKLRNLGFDVEKSDQFDYSIEKKIENKVLKISGLVHYLYAIQYHLLKEEAVVDLFKILNKKVESEEIPANSRIEIKMIHDLI